MTDITPNSETDESGAQITRPAQYVALGVGALFGIACTVFLLTIVRNLVVGEMVITEETMKLVQLAFGSAIVAVGSTVAALHRDKLVGDANV